MSIETFMNWLESSIDDLWKGDKDMYFKDNESHFITFGKDKWEVKYGGTSHHSNLIGVSSHQGKCH